MDTNDLKQSIAKLRERAEKARADSLREAESRLAIIDTIEDLTFPGEISFIHGQGYKSNGSISITAKTAEIPAIMDTLTPTPAVKIKGSFTSFYALERVTEKDQEQNTVLLIAPFLVELAKTASYPYTVTVVWWAKLGDLLLKISVLVSDGCEWAKLWEDITRDGGRIIKRSWLARIEKSQDQYTKWHAPHGQANHFTFYWTVPDLVWKEI